MYKDLAWAWPIISPPEDYETEAGQFREAIESFTEIPVRTFLNMDSNIGWDFPRCRNRGCPHYQLCFLSGVESGQKKKIFRVMEGVDCALGQSRVAVMVE